MYIPNPNNPQEILQQWTTTDGAVIGIHYCWDTKLATTGANTTALNTPLTLIVAFQDWQDNPLPDKNRPIKVIITGPGQPTELILNPVNGQAEFDFESPIAGTFIIQATADFACDAGTLEVTVNG